MIHPLTEKLKHCRGKGYYTVLKAIIRDIGPCINSTFDEMMLRNGGISTVDLGYIALIYNLNMKATIEWLEESEKLPTGTYDKIFIDHKVKVSKVYEAARETYSLEC